MRTTWVLILSFSLTVLASPASGSPRPKVVALLYNSTNDSSSTSNVVEGHIKTGFRLAIDELSSKKYTFVWVSAGEKAESTVSAFSEIVKLRPDLIVGPSHSSQVMVLLTMMKNAGIITPIVTPTATSSDLLRYENVVLISNSNRTQAKILMDEIQLERPKKILIVDLKDCVYCSNFVKEFERISIKTPIEKVSLNESEIEKTPLLSKRFDADAIVVPALEVETSKIIDRLAAQHPKAIFWGADGVGSLARFVQQLNRSDLRFRWLSHYHEQTKTKKNLSFLKKFKSMSDGPPVDTSAFYYEALKFGIEHILEKKMIRGSFETISGEAVYADRQVIRPMPLIELSQNIPRLRKMVEVQR